MARMEQAHEQDAGAEGQRVGHQAQVEAARARQQQPHSTFTVDEDRPSPGGVANGVWNGRPSAPASRCGTAFIRNTPPKNQAT